MRQKLIFIFLSLGMALGALKIPTVGPSLLSPMSITKNDSLEKILNHESLATNSLRKNSYISKPREKKMSQTSKLLNTFLFGGYALIWYFFTVVYNVSNKNALNAFPLPAVVSCLQLLVGLSFILPSWAFKMPNLTASSLKSFSIFSTLHALGLLTSVMALEAGAVSFIQIVRSAEPVFAALFSNLFLREVFSIPVILSLIPIIGGVGIASMTDFTFTQRGFILSMLANIFYQLRIVFTKQFMSTSSGTKSSSNTPSEIFQVLTVLSILQLVPVAYFLEGKKIFPAWNALLSSTLSSPPPFSSGISSFFSNKQFLSQFHSLSTEAVRLFVTNILISGFSFYLQNEVSSFLFT
jgi:drug/metabolite transporter (DMT)-like permease